MNFFLMNFFEAIYS